MTYRKKQKLTTIFCGVMAFLLIAAIIGNVFAWRSFALISQFLNQPVYKVVNADGEEISTEARYTSDYEDMNQLQEDETLYAKEVQCEGAVLLQNRGLPLKQGGKVTLLGYGSSEANFLVGGGGSGSIDTSKTPSLMQAFEEAGFEVNGTMWDFYESGAGAAVRATDNITEPAVALYGQEELASFSEYPDAAVIFIGRTGSEGSDIRMQTTDDPERSMLEFSQNELDLIDLATEHFENVVIVLNTMNTMELGALEDKNVSVLWVGAGGQQGIRAIPEILNGTSYPSGRLVDTYAYDLFSAPAMQNFGDFTLSTGDKYYNYAESIYVGYKYYETRYADKVNQAEHVGAYDYATQVQYPFGYGLSYASFAYSDFSVEEKGEEFLVSVKVTNTSENYKGKETVQIYMQSPYTEYDKQNGIEKAAVSLAGFSKTKELAPGEMETVQITVPKKLMRAYDDTEAKTYIVDAGDYYFAVGYNAHDALNNILAAQGRTVADGMTADGNAALTACYTQEQMDIETYTYGVDGKTKITNQFTDTNYNYYDSSFRYLTRSDWEGTFPKPLGGEQRQMEVTEAVQTDLAEKYPAGDTAEMPVTGAKNGMVLAELAGCAYDDEKWELLLDQMTAEEMLQLVSTGGWGTAAVQSIGKPATVDKDGPAGISSTLIGGAGCFGYPIEVVLASTWNLDLAEKMGYFIGEDGLFSGVPGWYAPAVNIHRTPFSGRNFEYYSEDSLLSGAFGAAVVKEAQAKGVYCYVKHFALNDQETNRSMVATWADEQAIREIYLAPFEDTVIKGGATALMSSMNRVGCVWSGAHRGLCTHVLREEWGFEGMVITDATTSYNPQMNLQAGLYAGNDLWLCAMSGVYTLENYAQDPAFMQMLRQTCHRILYVTGNSLATNNMAAGSQVETITPPWAICLIGVDVVIGVLFLLSVLLLVKNRRQRMLAATQIAEEEAKWKEAYTTVGMTSCYGWINLINIAVLLLGLLLEVIGGVVYSQPTGVGLNTALSPLMLLGVALTVAGFLAAVVISIIYGKKKIYSKLAAATIWIGALAVLVAVGFLVLTIVLPVFLPQNG